MTIPEIAEKAGVSIGTVDRVIHDRGHVSAEKRTAVESVIRQYGYSPNPIATQLKCHREFLIGVLIPHLHSETGYWNLLYNGIQKAVDELSPFSVSVVRSEFDRTKSGHLIDAGKRLIEKKVDALIIAPNQQQETMAFLDSPINVPYVFVDSPVPDATPLASVAQNPFQSGFCAGRMMQLLCPAGTSFLTIQFHKDTYNLTERAAGFSAFFDGRPNVSVCHHITSCGESETDCIAQALSRCPSPDGIYVTNDGTYHVAGYMRAHQKEYARKPIIVGYDLLPENKRGLIDNSIDCIISQSPARQGYNAVYTLYRKKLLFQEPDTSISIPIHLYFKENVADISADE